MNFQTTKLFRQLVGVALTINFAAFWALPVLLQGLLWKHVLRTPLLWLYEKLDTNPYLRKFAADYVYNNPTHTDFFATTLFLLANTLVSVGFVFYWQLTRRTCPWWLVIGYYFSWVGIGGRIMGAAYALAHKEGHNRNLYRKHIQNSVGNFIENIVGVFFGNVPWNFTTSHVAIHHSLDGGLGDTFYNWDIDRSSLSDFMLYVYRISLHMIGYSSIKYFEGNNQKSKKELLMKGIISYWSVAILFVGITKSVTFVFWIYIQPLFCMTYFLALLNIGFHGFIEYDENNKSIKCVNSTAIIKGDDDYFGEDDHMAHHYYPGVYYRDLPAHQATKVEEFTKYKASVFQELSILEVSIFILFGLWDELADKYVDYSGKMTKDEIKQMLKVRAQRKETTYEKYESYLANPTTENRKSLLPEEILKKSD